MIGTASDAKKTRDVMVQHARHNILVLERLFRLAFGVLPQSYVQSQFHDSCNNLPLAFSGPKNIAAAKEGVPGHVPDWGIEQFGHAQACIKPVGIQSSV